MTTRIATALLYAAALAASSTRAGAQKPDKPDKPAKAEKERKAGADTTTPPLFATEAPLAVTLTANIRTLRGDKSETSPYRAATMSYTDADGKTVSVPFTVKTHGVWRLKHCVFPPLRLKFSNKETKKTLFYDLQKPKMVSVCKDNDSYEQLLLKELQLYRVYQAITPVSHRVRTLKVSYADSATGKVEMTRYAFLFEDPDELSDRLGGMLTKAKGALSDDFDFSGAVNAPYATVDPQFRAKRVVDRMFRGYCAILPNYPAAIALIQTRKDRIYALYRDSIGSLLSPDNVKETLEYYDRFFDEVKTPRDAEANVLRTCYRR